MESSSPSTLMCKLASTLSNKPEDSQNVLLKQLLQNPGSNSTSVTSTSLVSRPVPSLISSQRAPSLGVVSSLEAQLARPVIPPAPAKPPLAVSPQIKMPVVSQSPQVTSNIVTQSQSAQAQSQHQNQNEVIKTTQQEVIRATMTGPTTIKIVTRETSFVSKSPVLITTQQQTTTLVEEKTNIKEEPSCSSIIQQQLPGIDGSLSGSGNAPPNVSIKKENVMTPTVPQQIFQQQQKQIQSHAPKPNVTFQQTLPLPVSSITSIASTEPPASSSSSITVSSSMSNLSSSVQTTLSTTSNSITMPISISEVKKENLDESSQSESINSDISATVSIKTEPTGLLSNIVKEDMDAASMSTSDLTINSSNVITDTNNLSTGEVPKTPQEIANELKKKKRREYQKNRRQMQNPKDKSKKARKMQKLEEDYDTFIDNLVVQLRNLPGMQILEPLLPKNYSVCQIYGCGDMNAKKFNLMNGELMGSYGKAELPSVSDVYNSKPFGALNRKPEQLGPSNQRGFYDQEFPPIIFEDEEQQNNQLQLSQQQQQQRSKYEMMHLAMKERDIDTPDTIISSSSPECPMGETNYQYPGLRLIQEDDEEEDELKMINSRMSPSIPIITPVPIRLKSGLNLTLDNNNKENLGINRDSGVKTRLGPSVPFQDTSNFSVTLTLSSAAAEDIMGVLRSLSNILHIPAPTTYHIVERTTTPPSQKLGLYRTKGKDGKEGTPIDIQTILNGTAKFCRHCDVVILNTMIRAKSSEFPLLANKGELESDDLYFCGNSCYKQFQWRPINILDEKALNTLADSKSREVMENIIKIENESSTKTDKVCYIYFFIYLFLFHCNSKILAGGESQKSRKKIGREQFGARRTSSKNTEGRSL